uniref:Uncharacterized protein n=1 Tax=Cucumis melo TaxID=3656 RepID=A0A9I9EDI8_CUCME
MSIVVMSCSTTALEAKFGTTLLPPPPPAYISFLHPRRRLCLVVVLAVATTVPSRCICKIFIVCSSRAFNILEILANKHKQSSLLFEDQLPSPSLSPTFEKLTFLDLTKQGKNKRNDKMAVGGSGYGQPQFLVRVGDENFSHAPLIENLKCHTPSRTTCCLSPKDSVKPTNIVSSNDPCWPY